MRSILQHISSVVWWPIETVQEISDHMAFRRRAPFRAVTFFHEADRAGYGSIPLVSLVSLFLGLTMALLSGYVLKTFGMEKLAPNLVAIAFTRELGPLLTGIMVAARLGAAFTAELGTMTVAEEVEAIESMGIGPRRLLIGPRLIAVVMLMPSLVVVSNLSALIGGQIISKWAFNIGALSFYSSAIRALYFRDIFGGVIKSFLFGGIIGTISCYKGLIVRGGAAGVGDATTSSVVVTIATVIGFDTLFNIVQTTLFS